MGLYVYIRLNTIIGITKNFWYYQNFLVSSFGTQKGAQRRLQVGFGSTNSSSRAFQTLRFIRWDSYDELRISRFNWLCVFGFHFLQGLSVFIHRGPNRFRFEVPSTSFHFAAWAVEYQGSVAAVSARKLS